jgi:glycosyltransferase involved in cell wall biosynthesis
MSYHKNKSYLIVQPRHNEFRGNIIDQLNLPRVSFCIPTLNNAYTLEKCLHSISKQNYPDFEIIIVDGYSDDNTVDIAKKYTSNIYFDPGKLGSARQTSISHSTGSIIALFDSDIIIPHKDWLKNAVLYFNYNNNISTVWPLYRAPPFSSSIQRLYQTNLYKLIIDDRIRKSRGLFGGGNSLFLKKAILQIGGVDRSLHWGEDFDWAMKLKNRGYQVVYIKDYLYHDTMHTLHEYTIKQFIGANTFTKTGFQLMNLSSKDVVFEHVFLGLKGMVHGLFKDKDFSWILFPIFLFIKLFAYSIIFLKNLLNF